ncbi:MAG TPA: AI-2E family transporter [Candidatus Stackebrandtia excrementipullorum]|nr:AI-2E family transporter [Candidatus Stackebrandtia excrementipullorum]
MTSPQDTSDTENPQPSEAASEEPGEAQGRGFGTVGRPFAKTPFHHGFYAGLGLLTVYVLYLSLEAVLNLVIIIVVAAFLAIGLNPLVTRLERWGMRRGAAVATVVLAGALILCGGVAAIIPAIVTEGGQFIEAVPDLVNNLYRQEWVRSLDGQIGILTEVSDYFKNIDAGTVFTAAGGLLSVLGVVFGTLFDGVIVLLLSVYLLVSFDRLTAGFYRMLPANRRQRARALGDEILAKVGGYTVGALGIGAIAGMSSLVFMIVAGVPYAYVLAFVVAVLDLIPQIGATLGAVVVTLVALTVSPWVAVATAVFFLVYQQVENWLVYPWVMRRSVKVSDLAAILAILLGAGLMGVVGALLAVPTVAAVQLLVREIYIPRQDSR